MGFFENFIGDVDFLLKYFYYNLRFRIMFFFLGGEEFLDYSYVIRGVKIINLCVIVDVIFVFDWLVLFVDVVIG